ncbi:MAG: hypothetical protein ACKVJN_14920, partial [Woeseiales bacterium]
ELSSAAGRRNHHAIVGGNPAMMLRRKEARAPAKEHALFYSMLEEAEFVVLVTLQYDETFPDLLRDTILQSPPEWLWLLRVHPQTLPILSLLESHLRKVGIHNFEMQRTSLCPIYDAMSYADHLVTGYSSTALEAESFELEISLFHSFAEELFEEHIRSGHMGYCTTAGDLLTRLLHCREARRTKRVRGLRRVSRADLRSVAARIVDSGVSGDVTMSPNIQSAYDSLLSESRAQYVKFPVMQTGASQPAPLPPVTLRLQDWATEVFSESLYQRVLPIGRAIHRIENHLRLRKRK